MLHTLLCHTDVCSPPKPARPSSEKMDNQDGAVSQGVLLQGVGNSDSPSHSLDGTENELIKRNTVTVPPCPTSTTLHPLCLPQICAVHPQPPTWTPPTATIAIQIEIGDHGSSVFNTLALPDGTPTGPNGLPTFSVGR